MYIETATAPAMVSQMKVPKATIGNDDSTAAPMPASNAPCHAWSQWIGARGMYLERGAPQGEVLWGLEATGCSGESVCSTGSGGMTRICGAPQWGQNGTPSSTIAWHL